MCAPLYRTIYTYVQHVLALYRFAGCCHCCYCFCSCYAFTLIALIEAFSARSCWVPSGVSNWSGAWRALGITLDKYIVCDSCDTSEEQQSIDCNRKVASFYYDTGLFFNSKKGVSHKTYTNHRLSKLFVSYCA